MDNDNDDVVKYGTSSSNGKADIPVLEINNSPKRSRIEQESVTQEYVSVTKSYLKYQATLGRFGIPTNDPFCTPNKDSNTFTPHICKKAKILPTSKIGNHFVNIHLIVSLTAIP